MTPTERVKTARKQLQQAQAELTKRLVTKRNRERAPILRQLHEIMTMLNGQAGYLSQAGQDRVVDHLLHRKQNGTFVDVGAYDGITGSNTAFFEQRRNWRGLMVEPVPKFADMAQRTRQSPCLQCAIADFEGDAELMCIEEGFTQMSGLIQTYKEEILQRVRSNARHKETTIQVKTKTLSTVLTENDIPNPDFVSLDIEGGELAVLQNFPFSSHKVGVWSIENNSMSRDLYDLMIANGYRLTEYCGPDEIYIHSEIT